MSEAQFMFGSDLGLLQNNTVLKEKVVHSLGWAADPS